MLRTLGFRGERLASPLERSGAGARSVPCRRLFAVHFCWSRLVTAMSNSELLGDLRNLLPSIATKNVYRKLKMNSSILEVVYQLKVRTRGRSSKITCSSLPSLLTVGGGNASHASQNHCATNAPSVATRRQTPMSLRVIGFISYSSPFNVAVHQRRGSAVR